MEKRVLTVLRSGGDFRPWHVQAMQRQVEQWAPKGTRFACLTDTDVPGVECVPLWHDWPGWWSKLELFRPGLGDFLFTDLDNVILGPLDDILAVRRFTTQQGHWTALMRVTEDAAEAVWDEWMFRPEEHIYSFEKSRVPLLNGIGNYGDAGFIASCVTGQHWETVLPGQAVNIVQMRYATPLGPRWHRDPPENTRVMLCGQPHRPWLLPMFRHMYQEKV